MIYANKYSLSLKNYFSGLKTSQFKVHVNVGLSKSG